jgi:hypothetical protein
VVGQPAADVQVRRKYSGGLGRRSPVGMEGMGPCATEENSHHEAEGGIHSQAPYEGEVMDELPDAVDGSGSLVPGTVPFQAFSSCFGLHAGLFLCRSKESERLRLVEIDNSAP